MVELRTIEEEVKQCPQLLLEDVKALREWARKQPHLPNIDDYVHLALFLRRRYYSLERAKQTLDNYFTFRTLVPDFSINRNTRSPDVKEYLKSAYVVLLDDLDLQGHYVYIGALKDPDPSKYNFVSRTKVWSMLADAAYLERGGSKGITIILDQKDFTLSHAVRTDLTAVKKANYFNKHCAPTSIKAIYVLNASSLIQKILTFFQPFVDGELFRRLKIFTPSQMDEFHKYFPQKMLPNEYGGSAGSLQEMHDKTVKLIERHEDFYERIDRLKVDESKRQGPEKKINSMFGLEGSFKKLNVD